MHEAAVRARWVPPALLCVLCMLLSEPGGCSLRCCACCACCCSSQVGAACAAVRAVHAAVRTRWVPPALLRGAVVLCCPRRGVAADGTPAAAACASWPNRACSAAVQAWCSASRLHNHLHTRKMPLPSPAPPLQSQPPAGTPSASPASLEPWTTQTSARTAARCAQAGGGGAGGLCRGRAPTKCPSCRSVGSGIHPDQGGLGERAGGAVFASGGCSTGQLLQPCVVCAANRTWCQPSQCRPTCERRCCTLGVSWR